MGKVKIQTFCRIVLCWVVILSSNALAQSSGNSDRYTQITAGDNHNCAIVTNGTAKCWGLGSGGQLGNGATSSTATPVTVLDVSSATAISAGGSHTCALIMGGGVRCWGAGGEGQLGNGATSNTTTPVTVLNISTAIAISAGNVHTCALIMGGEIRCWGAGGDGQLGNGASPNSSIPVAVLNISNATAISVGGSHTCALLMGGEIRCWGRGNRGQLGNDARSTAAIPVAVLNISNATAISAGNVHTCAVLTDNTARCWGRGNSGRLGNNQSFGNIKVPVVVTNLSNATTISAGNEHTCAVLADHTARCWGRGLDGQLGDNKLSQSAIPVTVMNISNATAISAGGFHTCALLVNGTTRCWGAGGSGQLGNGAIKNSPIPVAVMQEVISLEFITSPFVLTAFYDHPFMFTPPHRGVATEWSISGDLPIRFSFLTSNGTLAGTLAAASQATYSLMVTARNPGTSEEISTALDIHFINPPTHITIEDSHSNSDTISENLSENVAPGTDIPALNLRTVDENNNIYTGAIWSLVTTGTPFTIGSTNGAMTFTTALDYETDQGYTLTVQADFPTSAQAMAQPTLTALTDQIIIIISTLNVLENITITDTDGALNTVPENTTQTTSVAIAGLNLKVTDEAGNTPPDAVWSLLPNDSPFDINTTSGAIVLTTTVDYEATSKFTVYITVQSLTIIRSIALTIDIINLPDPFIITDTDHAQSTISEDAAQGTEITGLELIARAEGGNTITPSWNLLTTSAPFKVDLGRGTVTLDGNLDYENAPSYTITIQANQRISNVVETEFHTVVIRVINTLETLSIKDSDNDLNTLFENASLGTTITGLNLGVIDEGGNPYTDVIWSLIPNGAPFEITTPNGIISLTAALDYETTSKYTAIVRIITASTNSPIVTAQKNIEITVIDTVVLTIDPLPINGVIMSSPTASAEIDITCGFKTSTIFAHTGTTRTECTRGYKSGQNDQVTLTATANPLYKFSEWKGDCSSMTSTATLVMSQARTCSAVFTHITARRYHKITAGDGHNCAILNNGVAQCWGLGSGGQLGDGATSSTTTPITVQNITDTIVISAGGFHTCAIPTNGPVFCWGTGGNGQLGNGARSNAALPVKAMDTSSAVAVSAGGSHTCAILANGDVRCWGAGDRGQLGDGGISDSPIPVAVMNVSNATTISAGGSHTCAILADGSAYCWGEGSNGQLGNNEESDSSLPVKVLNISNPTVISAGGSHTCAVLGDNTARCWGSASSGRLGNNESFGNFPTPVTVQGLSNAIAISTGADHTCALLADNTARCWGRGLDGQLGNHQLTQFSTPVTVLNLSTAVAISAGGFHTCALLINGTTRCWGRGLDGQLGNGATDNSPVLVEVMQESGTLEFIASPVVLTATYGHALTFIPPHRGTALAWSLSGNLPTGLSFSTSNGLLSGTPTTASQTTYSLMLAASNLTTSEAIDATLNIHFIVPPTSITIEDSNGDPNVLSEDRPQDTDIPGLNLRVVDQNSDVYTDVSWSLMTVGTPFIISTTNGAMTFTTALDYERDRSYTLTVQVDFPTHEQAMAQPSLATLTDQITLTVSVLNVLESIGISDADGAPDIIPEDATPGTEVPGLNLRALDEAGNAHPDTVWSLMANGAPFAINTANGDITLTAALDFETTSKYSIVVAVQTLTLSRSVVIAIDVSNVVEPFAIIDVDGALNTVSEDATQGTTIAGLILFAKSEASSLITPAWLLVTAGVPFAVNATSGIVMLDGDLDYETTPSYTITIRASQTISSKVETEEYTAEIYIINTLEMISLRDSNGDPNTILENAAPSTEITALDLQVIDEGNNVYTGAAVWSLAPNDTPFAITSNSGTITLTAALDFETIPAYTVTVTAQVLTLTSSLVITINVRDTPEPLTVTDTDMAASTIPEDTAQGAEIPGLTLVVRNDKNDLITPSWSLISISVPFAIDPSSGVITLDGDLNYETGQSYATRIRASQTLSGVTETADYTVTIGITNVLEILAIQDNNPDFNIIPENAAQGTEVPGLNLGVVDEGGNAYTGAVAWSLMPNGTPFAINTANGTITITTALDYEMISKYTMTVRAQALTLTSSLAVTIDVSDTPEPFTITDTDFAASTLPENAAQGTTVTGLALIVQNEAGNPITPDWILVSTSAPFAIDPSSGVITLDGDLNYETTPSYTITIRASQTLSGVTETADYTVEIRITNILETLTLQDGNSNPNTVSEDATQGTTVAALNLEAIDEGGNTYTGAIAWSLTPNDTPFAITSNSGTITLTAALDYESLPAYTVTVAVQVSTLTSSLAVTINVSNVAEPFSIIDTDSAGNTLFEDAAQGTTITGLTLVARNEAGNPITPDWILVSTSAPFAINPSSGVITLDGDLNYETAPSYTITIRASETISSVAETEERTVVIRIINVLEMISIRDANSNPNTILENAAQGTTITALNLEAIDESSNLYTGAIAWSLMPNDTPFAINTTSGTLTLTTALDYEAIPVYTVTVRAQALTLTSSLVITINVRDTPQPFTITDTDPADNTLFEDAIQDTEITSLTLVARNQAGNPTTPTWSLVSTSVPFAIDPSNGVITLDGDLNYETTPSYTITTRASQTFSGVTEMADYTMVIRIINILETLTLRDNNTNANIIPEDTTQGTEIPGLDLEAIDEGNNVYTAAAWSLKPNDTPFAITTASGVVTLTAALDFETIPAYTVTVTVQALTLTHSLVITIGVSDVPEPFSIIDTDPTDNTIFEDAAQGTTITGLTLIARNDMIGLITPTWLLVSTGTSFAIHPSSGAITLDGDLNYETTPTYMITIQATDTISSVTETQERTVLIRVIRGSINLHIKLFLEGPLQ